MAKKRELPKTLAREDVAALMARCNLATPTGLRDRCMLAVMHKCGLRVSEACGLHLRDVRWGEARIHVRVEVAKGGREAMVYLDGQTLELLERWKLERRPYGKLTDGTRSPWLFVRVRSGPGQGGPLDRRDVYKMVRRRGDRAGIGHVYPHMLRHTFATDLLSDPRFNLREVQEACRHADVRTTQFYTHVNNAELAAKMRSREA